MITQTSRKPYLAPARDVGGEVAGVDVGDGGDEGGAEQGEAAAHAALARDARAAALTCGGAATGGGASAGSAASVAGGGGAHAAHLHAHRVGEPAAEHVHVVAEARRTAGRRTAASR